MPARTKRIFHDENTRAKIQTTQIINRLTKHIFGEIEMSASQVRAAEILLNKRLPNLAATENVTEVIRREPVADPYYTKSSEQWQKSVGDHNPAPNTH